MEPTLCTVHTAIMLQLCRLWSWWLARVDCRKLSVNNYIVPKLNWTSTIHSVIRSGWWERFPTATTNTMTCMWIHAAWNRFPVCCPCAGLRWYLRKCTFLFRVESTFLWNRNLRGELSPATNNCCCVWRVPSIMVLSQRVDNNRSPLLLCCGRKLESCVWLLQRGIHLDKYS